MKDYADQLSKVLITASEICTILYLIRKPNSNNSKFLTSFAPRTRSSKHLPVSRHSLRLWTDVFFIAYTPQKADDIYRTLLVRVFLDWIWIHFQSLIRLFRLFIAIFLNSIVMPRRCLFVWMIVYWQYTFIDVRVTCTSKIV